MQASIGQGSRKITWSTDESISPMKLHAIQSILEEDPSSWQNSIISEIAESLARIYTLSELKEKILDEDPEFIAEISILLQLKGDPGFFDFGSAVNYRTMAILYVPVIFALVRIFKQK